MYFTLSHAGVVLDFLPHGGKALGLVAFGVAFGFGLIIGWPTYLQLGLRSRCNETCAEWKPLFAGWSCNEHFLSDWSTRRHNPSQGTFRKAPIKRTEKAPERPRWSGLGLGLGWVGKVPDLGRYVKNVEKVLQSFVAEDHPANSK